MPREKCQLNHLAEMIEHFETIHGSVALSEIFNGTKRATDNLFQNFLSPQAGSIIVPSYVLNKLICDLRDSDSRRDVNRAFNQFIQTITHSGQCSSASEEIRKLVSSNLGRMFGPENV